MKNVNDDINFIEYNSLLKSDEWYNKFKGQYVVFVDGKFVDNDSKEDVLLNRVRELYQNKSKFLTQVDRTLPEFNVPSVLKVHTRK